MALQAFTIISTLVIFLVNALLAVLLSNFYLKNKGRSYQIWSSGLKFFAIAIIVEILFAFGVSSSFLIGIYLIAITIPMLAFSLGHIQYIKSEKIKQYYYYYSIAISFFFIYTIYASKVNTISNLPILAYAASILITSSASVVLFVVAFFYYMRKKELKLLSIIPGVALFWVANLIPLNMPQLFVYYLNILAVAFIWIGFIGFCRIKEYQ